MFKSFLWRNIFLFFILGFALFFRLREAKNFTGLSLIDGGRDVLVAKRMVDGATSLWTAPWSSISLIPNTSFYYLILSFSYFFFGYMGPTWLHIGAGVLVVFFVYKIVSRISGKRWLGIVVSFFAVFSDTLIFTSSRPWQPNLELFFSSIAFYFYFEGFFTKKTRYYWLSLLFTWFMLLLHNSALPLVFILCIFLFSEYKEKLFFSSHAITKVKAWGSMIFIWASWFLWAFLPMKRSTTFNLITEISIESHILDGALEKFVSFVFSFPSILVGSLGYEKYFWWKFFLFIFLITVLVKNFFKGPLPKKISLLFLLILCSFITLFISPGENFNNWYFYTQLLFVFILVLLLPWLIAAEKKLWYIPQILFFIWWIPLTIFQPRFTTLISPKPQQEKVSGLFESVVVAEVIRKDIRDKNILKDDFTIIVQDKRDVNSFLFSRPGWTSASVQLILELQDPQFFSRMRVVPGYWANVKEPDTNNYYFVCVGYKENHLNCLESLINLKKKVLWKDFIINFESSENHSVAIYFFRTQKN